MTDAPEPTPDRLTVEIDGCEVTRIELVTQGRAR